MEIVSGTVGGYLQTILLGRLHLIIIHKGMFTLGSKPGSSVAKLENRVYSIKQALIRLPSPPAACSPHWCNLLLKYRTALRQSQGGRDRATCWWRLSPGLILSGTEDLRMSLSIYEASCNPISFIGGTLKGHDNSGLLFSMVTQ